MDHLASHYDLPIVVYSVGTYTHARIQAQEAMAVMLLRR